MDFDLINWMLVFVRASAFLMILPLFSTPNVPVQFRVAVGAAVAFFLAPTLPPSVLQHASLRAMIGTFAWEAAAGLVIGFVSRMVFYTADLAGTLIANELGLNMGSMMNPGTGEQTPVPGTILFFLTAVTLLSLDLHHELLLGFQRTYLVLPIGGGHLREALFYDIVGHTRQVFEVALRMAAPLIAVSFIIMFVFSVLGRAVPQMNVFSESFGVRVLCGMAVFGGALQIMAQHLINYLHRLPEDMVRVAQLMGKG